ncbi:MAG: ROK family protein [Bacteroidota bacterium]|nr:ROK family protein [Bacteroidota bacterium]
MKESEYTIGIDIGGTNTTLGIVDEYGRCVKKSNFSTSACKDAGEFISSLVFSIHGLCSIDAREVQPLGIGIAAPAAQYREGIIQSPANLLWGTINIAEMLKQHYDLPIAVINDSNAVALGEMNFGLAQGMENFVALTLGTGLGAGVVVDGKLVTGENGFAGELGHVIVEPNGRMCGCKRRGCVETYVSATGICRTAFELLASELDASELRTVPYNELTAKKLYDFAAAGDILALKAFEITGVIFGRMLANVVASFDSEAIILSGGLVNAGELLLKPTLKAFDKHVLASLRGKVAVLPSRFSDGEGAILGASSIVNAREPVYASSGYETHEGGKYA